MAQAPQNVQLTPEGYDAKDRPLIQRLAGTLNSFLLTVADNFNKSLTFSENFAGETKSVKYVAGETYTFKYGGRGQPRILLVGQFRNLTTPTEVLTSAVGLPQWSWDGRGNITISSIPGLTPTNQYELLLVITTG